MTPRYHCLCVSSPNHLPQVLMLALLPLLTSQPSIRTAQATTISPNTHPWPLSPFHTTIATTLPTTRLLGPIEQGIGMVPRLGPGLGRLHRIGQDQERCTI